MVNKSTLILISHAVLLALPVYAEQPKCHVKQTVQSETDGTLPARQNFDIHVEERPSGRYCVVRYDVGTYSASGEELIGELGEIQSCGIAEQKANASLAKQINDTQITALSVMECDERSNKVWTAKVGAVAGKKDFKRDLDRPKEFKWNGTQCFWFQDVEWKGELNPFHGVACQLNGDQYVVVDKF